MFFAGVTFYAVSLNQTIVALGGQKYHVQKINHNEVLVEVMGTETKSMISSLGIPFNSISRTYLSRLENGMSFRIDLERDETRMAYEDLLKGNALPIQKMADDRANDDVEFLSETSTKITGKLSTFKVGVPLVPVFTFSRMKGEMHNLTKTKYMKLGAKATSEYGIYLNGSRGRLIKRQRESFKLFYGGKAKLEDKEGKLLKTEERGHFLWAFIVDKTKVKKLRKTISKIAEDTFMPDVFSAIVPGKRRQKIGYTQIAAEFVYTTNYLNHLHTLNTSSLGLAPIQNKALELLKKYSSGEAKGVELCNSNEDTWSCERRHTSEIKRTIKKLSKNLHKMLILKNGKEYSLETAQMGAHVWKNPFVFRAFIEEGSKCGLSINYDILGREISYFNKQYHFIKSSECRTKGHQ
jgi:hypothetical protein